MLSVLVLSPNPSVPGGVSAFIDCMKRHVAHSRMESFYVGGAGTGRPDPIIPTLVRLLAAPVKVAQLVRRQKFDVVHINPSFDVKSLVRDGLFVLALRAVGFRNILIYWHAYDFGVQDRINNHKILRSVVAWVFNQAALHLVLGNKFRDGLASIGIDIARIAVTRTMYEGNFLQQVQSEPPKNPRPYILFMSRFDPEKGARELVHAFANMAQEYLGVDLVLAGDGIDKDILTNMVEKLSLKNRIIFAGYVGGIDKWRWLRDCTIFALPTYFRKEGMPVAILEAMGAGKPLLVGTAGSICDIVSDPENGVVMDDVSPATIEKGLRRLLADPAAASEMGARNAVIAQTKFEAASVTSSVEDFYQKVAAC